MKKIVFTLEETELCFIALSYICSNLEFINRYKEIQVDNKIEFPHNDLELISMIISDYKGEGNILENFEAVKEFSAINMYSEIINYSSDDRGNIYYKRFIDRIIGNVDEYEETSLIEYEDSKKAFLSYIGGNFKALIKSKNEFRFAKWNGKAWDIITDEEARIVYNDFIKKCEIELIKTKNTMNSIDKSSFDKLKKKVNGWDNKNRVNEALDKVKRDDSYIVDMDKHDKDENIICSKNGKIINLNTGEIKKSSRNDLVLNTSKYNLIDKEKSIKFMNEKLKTYENVLGKERLNFILDLISYKLLGKNLQKAIFFIGPGATGKSTFKNIVNDLLESNIANIPYTYFTTKHKGNEDVSRDDLLASLDGKYIGWSSEGETDDIINQAKFKNILSNSTEKARETRGKLKDIDLGKLDLIIDTNDIPQFTNYDDAVNRRLLFVKFLKKIPLENRNSNFYREEIKPNFDYVFSYFIHRALTVIGREFIIPKCIEDDTVQNIKELDSLLKFYSEIITPLNGVGSYIDCSELEKEYINMCQENNLINIIPDNIIGSTKGYNYLFNRLKECKGYEEIIKDRVSAGSSVRKKYAIRGIAFIETDNQEIF